MTQCAPVLTRISPLRSLLTAHSLTSIAILGPAHNGPVLSTPFTARLDGGLESSPGDLSAFSQILDLRSEDALRKGTTKTIRHIFTRRPQSPHLTHASTTLNSPADIYTTTQAAGAGCVQNSYPSQFQEIVNPSKQDQHVLPRSASCEISG